MDYWFYRDSLAHAGKKGMKWGYTDGSKNGNRTAKGIKWLWEQQAEGYSLQYDSKKRSKNDNVNQNAKRYYHNTNYSSDYTARNKKNTATTTAEDYKSYHAKKAAEEKLERDRAGRKKVVRADKEKHWNGRTAYYVVERNISDGTESKRYISKDDYDANYNETLRKQKTAESAKERKATKKKRARERAIKKVKHLFQQTKINVATTAKKSMEQKK